MKYSLAIASALTLMAFGCDKAADGGGGGDETEAAEKKVEEKAIDTLFTTKAPTLPAAYKTLMPGMSGEDAKKIVPGMPDEDTIELPEYPDIRFNVSFDKKTGKISRFYFDLPKDKAEATLTKAWGAPIKGVDTIKKPVSYWFNAEAGLRATLEQGYGDEMKVEFTAYLAAEKFIGAEGAAFAFEAKQPLLGATIEQLRAAYPGVLVEKSQAQADTDRKKMEAMMGEDKAKLAVLGHAKPSAYLDFPPTEYESYWTRVNLSWDDEGKVERYRFKLAFAAFEGARQPLFDMLTKKLGAVTEAEKYGRKNFTFAAAPGVEVEEDTISKGWDVSVEAPKP